MKQNLLLIFAFILVLGSNHNMFASGPARDLKSSPVYADGANYYSFFDSDDENGFKLYVSQGILNIKYPRPQELLNGEVIVYNLLGQEITRKKLEVLPVNQISIPVQNTCYLIRINYSGKVHTQKLIVSSN